MALRSYFATRWRSPVLLRLEGNVRESSVGPIALLWLPDIGFDGELWRPLRLLSELHPILHTAVAAESTIFVLEVQVLLPILFLPSLLLRQVLLRGA